MATARAQARHRPPRTAGSCCLSPPSLQISWEYLRRRARTGCRLRARVAVAAPPSPSRSCSSPLRFPPFQSTRAVVARVRAAEGMRKTLKRMRTLRLLHQWSLRPLVCPSYSCLSRMRRSRRPSPPPPPTGAAGTHASLAARRRRPPRSRQGAACRRRDLCRVSLPSPAALRLV